MKILEMEVKKILSPVSGFLKDDGFTHSLTPAKNCTFGCSYCYVPTGRVYSGLTKHDWEHWGQETTKRVNAADRCGRELNASQVIYCSPNTDPYQPAEAEMLLMPAILRAVAEIPPRVFVIQTRGCLILRDLELLLTASRRTKLRVSFSITTNDDGIRRIYESRCESIEDRLATIRSLNAAGIEVYPCIAPVLPCDPEILVEQALDASGGRPAIIDPFHNRANKPSGATTWEPALKISEKYGHGQWHEPRFQQRILERMQVRARELGADVHLGAADGPKAFGSLTV